MKKYLLAYEDGTDRVFRNVGIQNSDPRALLTRKHTKFRSRRKFENFDNMVLKNVSNILLIIKLIKTIFLILQNKKIGFLGAGCVRQTSHLR